MKLIDRITNDAKQQYTLVTEDGDTVVLALNFLASQSLWSFSLTYGDLIINGLILTCGPNIIRGYKNNVPFGIAITSTDKLDPFYQNDFISGRIKFYLLSAADVASVEAEFFT